MSILTNGGIPKDASDYTDYWARNMAIRAITYTFGFFNGSNLRYKSAYYAGLTVAHNWNEFYASDFNQLNEAINALGKCNSWRGRKNYCFRRQCFCSERCCSYT